MPAPAPSSKPNWQKLGVKPGETLHLLGTPRGFDRGSLAGASHAVRDGLPRSLGAADVALAFADAPDAMIAVADALRPLVDGRDVRVWIAYPKGGKGALTRDRGWEPVTALGLEGVSLVALDATWSALRVRDRAHTARRR